MIIALKKEGLLKQAFFGIGNGKYSIYGNKWAKFYHNQY
jgi:hypothetical protein